MGSSYSTITQPRFEGTQGTLVGQTNHYQLLCFLNAEHQVDGCHHLGSATPPILRTAAKAARPSLPVSATHRPARTQSIYQQVVHPVRDWLESWAWAPLICKVPTYRTRCHMAGSLAISQGRRISSSVECSPDRALCAFTECSMSLTRAPLRRYALHYTRLV
jgi:hypothetical protein